MKMMVWLAALLAGCTAIDPEVVRQAEIEKHEQRAERIFSQGFEVGEQLDKINFPRLIDSWGYIDNQAIWLESGPRRYYLVTSKYPCPELSVAQSIGLKSRTGSFLSEHDEIIVERRPAARCQVDAIYKMTRQRKKKEAGK